MILYFSLNIFPDILAVRTDTDHQNSRMYRMDTVRVLQYLLYPSISISISIFIRVNEYSSYTYPRISHPIILIFKLQLIPKGTQYKIIMQQIRDASNVIINYIYISECMNMPENIKI